MTISPASFPAITVTVVRHTCRKIRTALRTNHIAGFVTAPWEKMLPLAEYRQPLLSQLWQLTVTPDAVSAPCQNCRTMSVLHNLQNNTSQVRYLYLLLSRDTASSLFITSCLYLLAQSRSSRIKVSPSSIPNTAIKHKKLLQNITSSTT